jgi:hypothetical protein
MNTLNYPSLERVETASRIALAWWYRFLPSPGLNHVGTKNFSTMHRHERKVLERILERFNEVGGMSPEISKTIGLK